MKRRAFTLVELVVALALVATLAALLLPALGRYLLARQVEDVAERVRSDLAYLRAQALRAPNPSPSAALPPDREVLYSYRLVPRQEGGEVVGYDLVRQEVVHDLERGTRTPAGVPVTLRSWRKPERVDLFITPQEGLSFDHHGRAVAEGLVAAVGAGAAREVRLRADSPEIVLATVEPPDDPYGKYGRIDPGGSPTPAPPVIVPGRTITPGVDPGPDG